MRIERRSILGWPLLSAASSMVSLVLGLALVRALERESRLTAKVEWLSLLAMTDPLTGLANRRFFLRRLRQSLSFSKRRRLPLTLVLVDLDGLKEINDSHGHEMGDRVLKIVARGLDEDAREEDLVSRYGGDEFALILEGTDSRGASRRAERLRAKLSRLRLPDDLGGRVAVSASFGIACFPETSCVSPVCLLARADRALYKAKRAGRNRCVVATDPPLHVDDPAASPC